MSFDVVKPAATVLVSPINGVNVSTYTPTYTWNEVAGATYYYLWVNAPGGKNVIKQWYTSAQANCNGTICSITPSTVLAVDTHTWEVQTWNPAGYGPWSSIATFDVTAPVVP
jgi:hypothetical protein